jgi:hypothetical protein
MADCAWMAVTGRQDHSDYARMTAYPRSPKPDTAVPYVMWPDTHYEHLMIPVR